MSYQSRNTKNILKSMSLFWISGRFFVTLPRERANNKWLISSKIEK